ncbi:hypothetical protein GTV32_21380 [Gordonia sp. SID5947]|uniref:8-oxoguanine DNA glycosylase OGG fold protein n=1 Tax=Gordonia sp. SID5947 TaxID=2690315 RepID=UPI00136D32E0|nr:hypothetical protein [Gordonia sp. SID5947]MYR08703.1 hypothetical protein [Gordonia sp. SID5947]
MIPHELAAPPVLIEWLAAADRTAELLADTVTVGRAWWSAHLAERGLPEIRFGDTICRTELFGMAAAAMSTPDDAITLLWHTMAFCQGRRPGDTKRRIAAVAADRDRIGGLLHEAAQASREDPAKAFELLKPDRGGNVIERLGPTGFTWFLYFAGGGDPRHPSQVLEGKAARTVRRAGWKRFPVSTWTSDDYAQYVEVVDRWRVESGADRNDVIVRGLVSVSPSVDADYPWQAWQRETWNDDDWVNGPLSSDDLRQIYHWLALIADVYPLSSAAADFARIGPTISRALGGDIVCAPRLRSPGEQAYDDPFLLYNGRGSTPISRHAW